MRFRLRSAALTATALLASCSGSATQQSLEPSIATPVNPATQTTLTFAVGTANIAGTHGFNALETFRQSVGASTGASVLLNAPTISGPPGFIVPATADAGADAGKATLSGTIETSLNSPPPASTFNQTGAAPSIASAYGFLPSASTNSNSVPNLIPAPMPYFATATGAAQLEYIGGPPAFSPPGHTSTQDGTFNAAPNTGPGSYPGYTLGFNDFDVAPVAGPYALAVVVPTGINTSGQSGSTTVRAATTLALTFLPAWTTPPVFTPDGTGGGTIVPGFASGGGVTEEYVELVNTGPAACSTSGKAPYYYTFKVTPGQASVVVPDTIGAAVPGAAQPHTLCTSAENMAALGAATSGDGYKAYGFAVDYPLSESAFPASTGVVAPAIAGAAGQADVTTSAATTGNAP